MKPLTVNGVECVQVRNEGPRYLKDVADLFEHCKNCPLNWKTADDCTCRGHPYLPIKFVPILIMRGAKFHGDPQD